MPFLSTITDIDDGDVYIVFVCEDGDRCVKSVLKYNDNLIAGQMEFKCFREI